MTTIPIANEASRYEEVKQLIRWWAVKFHRRRGGELSELVAEGEMAFVRAARTYNPAKRPFIVYLQTCVWRALHDTTRKKRVTIEYGGLTDTEEKLARSLMDTLKELSWDTQTVARLLTEDVQAKPDERLNTVWRFLRSAGWSASRIGESFNEIRGALS